MNESGKYTPEQAWDEAETMNKSIEQGLAKDYAEAAVAMSPNELNPTTINDAEEIEKILTVELAKNELTANLIPGAPHEVTSERIYRAMAAIVTAESRVTIEQRLALFRQTLEYYAHPTKVEQPWWHSTNSYALLKALHEGFSGGHGKYSGEAGGLQKEGDWVQSGLSISHADAGSAETFQEMFARLSCRKEELQKLLAIDSEGITKKTLPEAFATQFVGALDRESARTLIAKRRKVRPEEVDEVTIANAISPDAIRAFVEDFTQRQYLPNVEKIRSDVLPNIDNTDIRSSYEEEAEHPFPCFITFEGSGHEGQLASKTNGESPTHIPFEDHLGGTLDGSDIREIRVPQSQMDKVRGWLQERGLKEVRLVPLEVFEIKRIIQDTKAE